MKKLYFFLMIGSLSISCEKPVGEVAKTETVCLIQKISYDDGNYELYKLDANNRLVETIFTYDKEGKITEYAVKHVYNAAGNLEKTSDAFGWTQNWMYDANGSLTRMDFKDEKGELYDQFTFTTDAQKRITKLITKSDGSTVTYEYNGPNGAFSKSEMIWEGKLIDRYIISSYEQDKSKKSYRLIFKGHPFEPAQFTYDMFYGDPLYLIADNLPTTGTASTQYDKDWAEITDKTRIYYDYKATRKFNSNNYVIERASADAIENKTYLKYYSYSNCN